MNLAKGGNKNEASEIGRCVVRSGEEKMPETPKNIEHPEIRLGVSTCLLGEKVRYDGGRKMDRYLVNTLGRFVEWVPVCPEVEMGLPTPRESMRLVAPKSGTDYTEQMICWAQGRLDELEKVKLHGFIFKKDSPSSGLFRVRVYNESGMPQRTGTGMFPRELMRRFPLMPLKEDGRLHDLPLCENFVERVFAYAKWSFYVQLFHVCLMITQV